MVSGWSTAVVYGEASLLLWFFYCCGFCCTSRGGRGNCRGFALHSHGTCRRRVGRTAGEGMEAVGTDNTSDVMRARRACFCFPKALQASNIDRQGCRSRERRHGIERVTVSLL